MRVGWGTSIVLIVALLSFASCSEDPSGGQGGGGGGTGSAVYGDHCGACVAEQCGSAFSACEAEPECASYVGCLFDCPATAEGAPEGSCAAACPQPSGSAAVTAKTEVELCTDGQLVSFNCPSCPGALPPPTHACFVHENCPEPEPHENPCVVCGREKCCGVRTKYEQNAEAQALIDCYIVCFDAVPYDPSCEVACDAAHPGGLQDVASVLTCSTYHCYQECVEAEPSPCEACMIKSCEASYGDVNCSAEGLELQNCIVACEEDLACEGACYDQYPDATAAGLAHVECIGANCDDLCGT